MKTPRRVVAFADRHTVKTLADLLPCLGMGASPARIWLLKAAGRLGIETLSVRDPVHLALAWTLEDAARLLAEREAGGWTVNRAA